VFFKSYRLLTLFAIAASVVFLPLSTNAQSVDYGGYRPHYQGYGVNTPGGRGGTVCKVTSTSDTAWPPVPGTFRYCVESSGPRFVIFETSGTISLTNGEVVVKNPYITIAGQTAPSPGIVIRGQALIVDTHDVVIQHVRVRVGAVAWEPHGLWIRDRADNVVVDHVSISWAIWTSLGIVPSELGGYRGGTSILDSIVSESLACSGVNRAAPCNPASYPGSGYSNSRAMLIRESGGVSLLRNIFAHNNDRQPETGGPTETILVNNLIYNPSLTPLSAVLFSDPYRQGPTQSVVQGNLLIAGPTTPGNNGYVAPEYREEGELTMVRVDESLHPQSSIYLDGNYYDRHCGGTACLASPAAQWRLVKDKVGGSIHASTPPLALDNLPLSSALPASQVESYLTANAGARPLDRDAVDARIAYEIATRTGSVPNTPAEKAGAGTGSDGFPILAVNARALSVPADPHGVIDSVGRTRIEAWLETFARELEPALQGQSGPPSPPPSSRLSPPGSPRFVF
jgi:hypothetical protein